MVVLAGCSEQADTPASMPSDPPAVETVESAVASYPLDTCVVSGEKLGTMGEVYEVEVEGRTVKLCCAGCEDQLRAEPAKYLAMLDDAAAHVHPNGDGHGHEPHDH
jgi:hypothetical protein